MSDSMKPPRVNGYSLGRAFRFLDDLPVEILPTADLQESDDA